MLILKIKRINTKKVGLPCMAQKAGCVASLDGNALSFVRGISQAFCHLKLLLTIMLLKR